MVPVLIEHARSASGSPPSPACGRGNEGEGGSGDSIWPEYTRAETVRWRRRTEKRLERQARTRHARRRKSVSNAANTAGATPLLPNDREKIRAEIRAAVERVKAKRKN